MIETSMTAMMSLFAKAHHQRYKYKILTDDIAQRLLTEAEYNSISKSISQGAGFFSPDGKCDLDLIMNRFISPTVIGRSRFAEKSLMLALKLGTKQYVILASGYDTSPYRINNGSVDIFEIDREEMISDKIRRLEKAEIDCSNISFISADLTQESLQDTLISNGFEADKISFISALGIIYYLNKADFKSLLQKLASLTSQGSTLIFDYPNESYGGKIQALAKGAGEEMQAKYSYREIEELLGDCGFAIYEHLSESEISEQLFRPFNTVYKAVPLQAQQGVSFCLCVKKPHK